MWHKAMGKGHPMKTYGEVTNVPDCDIVVSEFKLQLRFCVHSRTYTFDKGMNCLLPTPDVG